jgi:hypothetical protein
LYASPTDLEQPAFNNELIKDSFQHFFNLQLDQQFNEVLLCDFDDPIAVYLDSMSSIESKDIFVRRRLFLSSVQTFFLYDMVFITFGVKIYHND